MLSLDNMLQRVYGSATYEASSFIAAISSCRLRNRASQRPLTVAVKSLSSVNSRSSNSMVMPGRNDISNTRVMLTYEIEIDGNEYSEWLVALSRSKKVIPDEIRYSYTSEVTRVLVIWNTRFRSTSRTILDYKDCHPLLTYIGSEHELIRVKLYMARHNASFKEILAQQ